MEIKYRGPGKIDISTIEEGSIRKARLNLGLSQERAAAYCGVSCITYTRWEIGSTKFLIPENYEKLKQIIEGTVDEEYLRKYAKKKKK